MGSALAENLARGSGTPVGLFVKIPARETCELIANAGFDFVVIDTEHAPLGLRDVYDMVRIFDTLGVAPIVRTVRGTSGEMQRLLDLGVRGLMFPHVRDGEDARAITEPLLFPPAGSRGSGFASPAGLWGALPGGKSEYLRYGDEDVLRIAMIEDPGAVDAITDIASAPGVNAVFVGASDLALSMGVEAGSPEVEEKIRAALEGAVAVGIPTGVIATSREDAGLRASQGCEYLVAGNDTGLIRAALEGRRLEVAGWKEGN